MRPGNGFGLGMATIAAVCIGAIAPITASAAEDHVGVGDGHHGNKIVTGVEVVNAYSKVAVDVAPNDTSIEVADGSKFAAGDLVIVWQVNGLPTPASGDQTDIDLSSGAVGRFEFARVDDVTVNTLALREPMVNAFSEANTQVVFVPEYDDVTIGAGDEIQATPWDPTAVEGGLTAFMARGTVTIDGRVTANGAGFVGGTDRGASGANGCTGLDQPSPTGAEKGEGIAGLDLLSGDPPGGTGRGNRANGGGGGVCHNSGGGGGGHGGLGGLGGRTWRGDPDPSIAGTGRDVGGLGGASISYSALTRMTMGGGGGSGHQNNNVGGTGSSGGGVVLVRAGAVAGSGSFEANGDDGGDSVGSRNDAAGGAGAGGLVVVRSAGPLICGAAEAAGGEGGSALTADHGTGGGGAGGHTLLQGIFVACATDVSGGIPGVQTDLTEPPGAHYGAMPGGAGDVEPIEGGLLVDSDQDGLFDVYEGSGDTDGDGVPNYLDVDDDGDGIRTAIERSDPNEDGSPADAEDRDSDGLPDYLDRDSDGDGLTDVREAGGQDVEGDGLQDNCVDTSPADGGCDGVILLPPNTDRTLLTGDTLPDYLDGDSDGDTLSDNDEAFDEDGDGLSDVTPVMNDHDNDGIDDAFDRDCFSMAGPGCLTDALPITFLNVADADGDGVPNWMQNCGDGYETLFPSPEVCDDGDGDDTNACNNACRFNAGYGPCSDASDCADEPGMVCNTATTQCQFENGAGQSCTAENEDQLCAGRACDIDSGTCVECADASDCQTGERCAANTCVPTSCGDGVVDPAEACDNGDANGIPPEACAVDCRFNVGAACNVDDDCTGDATCSEDDECAVPDPRTLDSDGDGVPDAAEGLSVQGGGGFGGCHVGVFRQSAPTNVLLMLLLALSLAIRRYQRP